MNLVQEKALTETSESGQPNPMWPMRLPVELLAKIADYMPASLPVYDRARFELWKKGVDMQVAANADDTYFKEGFATKADSDDEAEVWEARECQRFWVNKVNFYGNNQVGRYQRAQSKDLEEDCYGMILKSDLDLELYCYD